MQADSNVIRIAMVDDHALLRSALASTLNKTGNFSVIFEAANGDEMITRIQQGSIPDVILLDLNMPRFGGHEFRRAQLADPVVAGVPVVVMSGATDAAEWARSLGAVATVTKPIALDLLLQVVRRHCGVTPLGSADESHLYFRMRPRVGEPAWLEYEFTRPTTIATSDVYFADDRRFCRLPASWRLLYRERGEWKPVSVRGAFGVAKDRFNRVAFAPVTTTGVRIEIEPVTRQYKAGEIGPPEAMFLTQAIAWRELGVIEWRVR